MNLKKLLTLTKILIKLKMEKLLVGSAKHLELAGELRNPDYLMLNLPFECNYSCLKCCNRNRKEESRTEGEPLTLEEISSLIDEASDLGIRVVVLAGEGEPLLNKNIDAIVEEIDKRELIPYIFTNGSLLNEEIAQHLKQHNASLVINLDTLDRQLYEELAGIKDSFDVVYENLKNIRRVFSDTFFELGGYQVRRIAINTVITPKNIDTVFVNKQMCGGGDDDLILQPMLDFCGDDFVLVYNSPMLIGNAQNNVNSESIPTIEEKIRHFSEGMIPLGTTSDGRSCAYMRNGISVGSRGEILICAYSLESAGLLGNVRDGGLKSYLGAANSVIDIHVRCALRDPSYYELVRRLK